MFSDVFRCFQMFSDAFRCLQMFSDVFRCFQMFLDVFRCSQDALRCSQMFYRCSQMPGGSLGSGGSCGSGGSSEFCGSCESDGLGVVDCPTQLTLVTWICQLCSKTNTSEKYERTQPGNLLGWVGLVGILWVL